jgi:hypothetical protein
MNQFANYEQLSKGYVPNNVNDFYKFEEVVNKPYTMCNDNGDVIGYYWHYGDTVNLQFDIYGEVTVSNDAILLNGENVVPNENTMGHINQLAYNITDSKCWKCVGIDVDNNTYIWEEVEWTMPNNLGKSIYVSADKYVQNKMMLLKLYNFRYEEIYSQEFESSNVVNFTIDSELSNRLLKGVYYLTLTLLDSDSVTYMPIIKDRDCQLLVK